MQIEVERSDAAASSGSKGASGRVGKWRAALGPGSKGRSPPCVFDGAQLVCCSGCSAVGPLAHPLIQPPTG